MRSTWTDERLDDGFDRLSAELVSVRREVGSVRDEVGSVREEIGSVRDEVGSVREEVGSVREEVGAVRDEVAGLREEMHQGNEALLKEIHRGIGSLQRTLLQTGGGIIAVLLGILLTPL